MNEEKYEIVKELPKIHHKFNIGDFVFIIHNNRVVQQDVKAFQIIVGPRGKRIIYTIVFSPERPWDRPEELQLDEEDLFETKKELIDHIYNI